MKKQIFTLVMLLALVAGAVSSTWAQNGDGMLPSTPILVTRGSTSQFTITETGTAAQNVDWAVLELAQADADAYTGSTAATAGTDYQFVTSLTDATTYDPSTPNDLTAYVKWLGLPTAGNLFIVQVTTNYTAPSACSTVRRFYVSVFDFEVNAYLCGLDGVIAGAPTLAGMFSAEFNEAAKSQCNSWSGQVIHSTFSGANMAAMFADSIDNEEHDSLKLTSTYYAVRIGLSGNPSNLDLNNIKWRFRYSIQNPAILDIYDITLVPASSGATTSHNDVEFMNGTDPFIRAADIDEEVTIAATTGWNANNEVAIGPDPTAGDVNENLFIFRVRTHNMAGQNLAQTWDIRIDEAQLETTSASTSYNDGRKVHADIAASYDNPVSLVDGQSSIQSITQSPATSRIVLTD